MSRCPYEGITEDQLTSSTPLNIAYMMCNISEIMPVLPDVDGGHEEGCGAENKG
jgi:hypothetical protein